MTSTLDLFETLPTGRSQSGRKVLDTKLLCFLCSSCQTKGKAQLTTFTSLGLSFKSADILLPLLMVVVAINPFQPQALCMALTLILTDLVFFAGEDVRIIIEDHRTNIMLYQPLDNRRGTRCTTGMQQHLLTPLWNNNCRPLHLSLFTINY